MMCQWVTNGQVALYTGAPNENSWQITAPQPACSWLAGETEQIQNPSWQTENITML